MIESELYDFFAQYPEIVRLIGDGNQLRFFPDYAPAEEKLPLVVYSSLSGFAGLDVFDGDNRKREERVRFNVLSTYTSEAIEILNAMEKILHGKVLTMGKLKMVSPSVTFANSAYDEDPKVYRRIVDYKFSYFKGEKS